MSVEEKVSDYISRLEMYGGVEVYMSGIEKKLEIETLLGGGYEVRVYNVYGFLDENISFRILSQFEEWLRNCVIKNDSLKKAGDE